jgi:hypothetical protein
VFEVVKPVSPVFLVNVETIQRGNFKTADINGDGNLDLVATNGEQFDGAIQITLGNGDGTFRKPISYRTDSVPFDLVTADFNHDGHLDIAEANALGQTVEIFLGVGDGTFMLAGSVSLGTSVDRLNAADYNGDGNLDLAVAVGATGVELLLGNGDGTFQPATNVAIPYALDVVTADFNHDGKLDLATVGQNYITFGFQLGVAFGNGDGTFGPATEYSLSSAFQTLVGGDFNGDGNLDLAFADNQAAAISVLLGKPDGTFQSEKTYSAPAYAQYIETADIDGDGNLDIISPSEIEGLSVLLGNGDGSFQPAITYSVMDSYSAAVGDFNNDGAADIATAIGTIFLEGPIPAVSLNPVGVFFRAQLVGTTSNPYNVSLTNTGNASLQISAITVSGPPFAQTNTCGTSLAGGATCTIAVTFSPQDQNRTKGTLTIADNALLSPQTVPLSGSGTVVTLVPGSLNFGKVKGGHTSDPKTVTMTNTGTTTLAVTRALASGYFSQTNDCPHSLTPGSSCTFTVTFSPKYRDVFKGTLTVYDSSGGAQNVGLTGQGT